jgi:DNA-binding MarR family transcriptional regulator
MSRETRDELFESLGLEVRAQQNATELVDDAGCRLIGVNRTDGRCLDIIDQHGRITAGDLAREAFLTTGAVTAVLDRLEAAGLVRRVRDDADRRKVYVEVTPETLKRMHDLYGPLATESRERMEHYTNDELTLLRDFVRMGKELTQEHAQRLQAKLDESRDIVGSVARARRTAIQAKQDVKEAVDEVKRLAKAEKTRVKQQTKDMKADIKRAVKGG